MMIAEALRYLSLGWSVIPLKEREKTPIVSSWKEYQTKRPDRSMVLSWWARYPRANVGIVTGKISDLVVVDADSQEGLDGLSRMGIESPAKVTTGKGAHFYFRRPENVDRVQNTVRSLPGVDIRGDGGYVVAPPSVHPSGRIYRWMSFGTLPLFPMVGDKQKLIGPKNESGWIAKALSEMEVGNIDNTLFKVCSRLRHDGFTADDAKILLMPHAEKAGASPGHLQDKIDNVWGRYDSKISVSASNAEAFLETVESVRWVAEPFVPAKSIGFIAGLPETCKTWIAMDLAIECARDNGKWLERYPVSKSRVLFIDQERFKGETQRRFRALLAAKGLTAKDISDNLFIRCGTKTRIDLQQSYEAFHKELMDVQPDVVIVDSFVTFHTREENNRKDSQEVLERIKGLRDEFGCTFFFIDHESKSVFSDMQEGETPSAMRMAGSVAKVAAAEFVLTVRKQEPGRSFVYHTKSTMSKAAEPFVAQVEDMDEAKSKIRVYAS